MKTLRILTIVIIILLLIPLFCWVLWKVQPSKKLDLLIVDKSVMDSRRTEHLALVWSLNHNKFHKSDNKPYSKDMDYYGFLPLRPYKGRNFDVKRIKLIEIDQLAGKSDGVYFADNYGVNFNEWFSGMKKQTATSQIIGGFNQNDFLLLNKMIEKGKLIIAEYDLFGHSTEPLVKHKTEDLLNINNTGWIGKYFSRLDSSEHQVPDWIISSYKHINDGNWPFKGSGIVLARGASAVVVLQKEVDLTADYPMIRTNHSLSTEYGLPDSVRFSGWFEITFSDSLNKVFSEFALPVNEDGLQKLAREKIPAVFPAVLMYKGSYQFWYFCGDFSHVKMPYATYKLKGWKYCSLFRSVSSGKEFVWDYYLPLTSKIFNDLK